MLITSDDIKIFKATAIGEWLDCLFWDCTTEESFYVELRKEKETYKDFIKRCLAVAKENFEDPKFQEIVDAATAEQIGLDTY